MTQEELFEKQQQLVASQQAMFVETREMVMGLREFMEAERRRIDADNERIAEERAEDKAEKRDRDKEEYNACLRYFSGLALEALIKDRARTNDTRHDVATDNAIDMAERLAKKYMEKRRT